MLKLAFSLFLTSTSSPFQLNSLLFYRLEKENSCCGVSGPHDYNASSVQLPIPASCCIRQATQASNNGTSVCENNLHHMSGCDERLLVYLRSTASLLAILGYCVLAFLKMCFLGMYVTT